MTEGQEKSTPQQILTQLLIETVRLAIIRHDLRDSCGEDLGEDDAVNVAEDAAWAMQGEGTCDETPAKEWTAALRSVAGGEPDRNLSGACSAAQGEGISRAISREAGNLRVEGKACVRHGTSLGGPQHHWIRALQVLRHLVLVRAVLTEVLSVLVPWLRRIRGRYKLAKVLSYYASVAWTSDWDRVNAALIVRNALRSLPIRDEEVS